MPALSRFKFWIEYDGSPYKGWQRQKEETSTVQEKIEDAIFSFCQQKTLLYGAGRTDRAVHAIEQIAHADLKGEIDVHKMTAALNFFLKEEAISILKIEKTTPEFHARFSAKARAYEYHILNRPAKPSFERKRITHIRYKLNIEKMQEAANMLIGKYDLSSFRAAGCQANSPIKTIDEITLTRQGEQRIVLFIKAPSFLYHQVRNIVGTLLKIGAGKWDASEMKKIRDAKDRSKAGPTAPADGLYLAKIFY